MFAFQAINHIIKENKRSIGEIRQKESCSSNRKEHFQESNAKIKKYELLENDTNIEDISRITLGANILSLRTPYGNGEHHHSITQESVDKLLKVLDIIGEEK